MGNNPWNLNQPYNTPTSNGLLTSQYQPMTAGAGTAAQQGVAGNTGAALGGGIGGVIGLLSAIGANNDANTQAREYATTTKYSPWTKLRANLPAAQNPFGQILGYGASGATMGQGLAGGSMLPLAAAMG